MTSADDADTAPVRVELNFCGSVQGVGFRAETQRAARAHAVVGGVRNERDGSVRAIAEGSPESVDQFLAELDRTMGRLIRERTVDRRAATGEFTRFEIWQ